MKKLLLTAALTLAGLGAAPELSAKSLMSSPLDRTDWVITGCSEHNANGEGYDGGFRHIKDGNRNTFWHSEYGRTDQGHNNNAPHYFLIDRGENAADFPFIGFGYLPRLTAGNGFATSYRLFVLDNVEGLETTEPVADGTIANITDGHASLTTFLEGKTPVSEGDFVCSWSDVKTHHTHGKTFSTQTGRYVLFVIDNTSSDAGTGNHANCAEFNLYASTQEVDIETECTLLKDALAEWESFYRPFVGKSGLTAYDEARYRIENTVDVNEMPAIRSEASSVQPAWSMMNGIVVTLKNVRRAALDKPSYLTVMADSTVNTVASVSEACKWVMYRVGNSRFFNLYNPQTRCYISASDNSKVTTDPADACRITIVKNNDPEYPGIALPFTNSNGGLNNNGLNLHPNGTSPLTSWGYTDGGSSWVVGVSSSEVDELDLSGNTYYRIRSTRALEKGKEAANANRSLGLLGINTVVEDNVEISDSHSVITRNDGLGTLWTLHAADDGKVIIRNAAADYEGNDGCLGITGTNPGATAHSGNNYTLVSTTPTPVKIVAAKGVKNSVYDRNDRGLAILTLEREDAANLFMDHNGSLPIFSGWNYCNNDFPNNGGVYYFEVAEDAQNMIDNYLRRGCGEITAASVNAKIDQYEALPALWDKNAIDAARASLAQVEFPEPTVRGANKKENIDHIAPKVNEIYSELASKIPNVSVQFENVDRNNGSGHFMTYADADPQRFGNDSNDAVIAIANAERESLKAVWTIVKNPNEANYKLVNYHSGKELKHRPAGETAQGLADAGDYFFLEPNVSKKAGAGIVLQIRGGSNCLHEHSDGQGNRIVKWSDAAGSEASGWRVTLLDDILTEKPVNVSLAFDGENHFVKFSHPTGALAVNPEAASSVLRINISAVPAENDANVQALEPEYTVDMLEEDPTNESLVLRLNQKLDADVYDVDVPAGIFVVGSTPVKGNSSRVTIDPNGGVTGIGEVEAAESGVDVIFDLQGRRLSAPVKGINIINGKKILVK